MTTTIAPQTTLLLPLDVPRPEAEVGGKAARLGVISHLGLAVPPGFVILPDALRMHLDGHDIAPLVSAGERAVAVCTPQEQAATTEEWSRRIHAAVTAAALDDHLRDALRTASAPLLATGPVVVRSSAIGEDSASESYAGQLDSFLHVADLAGLEHALRACWASCWSARALAYRATRGLASAGMSVVVQRQVDPAAAGVMFTRASDDSVVIEFVAGLADRLVAGAEEPGAIALGRDGVHWRTLAPAPAASRAAEAVVLAAGARRQLAAAACRLEQHFGVPQDVEWTIDAEGTLAVVQSRPITAPLVVPPAGEARPLVRWSNANINENFPAPVSPLLYSIARAGYASYFRNLAHAFGFSRARIAAMREPLAHVIGAHGGRLYYNLTSIHSILRTAPFGDALVRAFNRFVGTEDDAGESTYATSPLRDRLEVTRIVATTVWRYRALGRGVTRFEAQADAFAARSHPARLAALDRPALRALLGEFMAIRCHRWVDASLADAAAMAWYAALHRLVHRTYGDAAGALHNTLLKAIPNLVSGEPVHRLWELARMVRRDVALAALLVRDTDDVLAALAGGAHPAFARELDRYLEDWGFRCSSELMLTVPSYQEEPGPLLDTIRAYARHDGESPAASLARQLAERDMEIARVLRDQPWFRRPWFRIAIGATQAAIACRERARLKQALLYSRCRRIALALGERLVAARLLAAPDDVYWLEFDELMALAAGDAFLPAAIGRTIDARRAAHAAASAASPPPDSFLLPAGEYFDVHGTPDADGAIPIDPDAPMVGTGACGGIHVGPAAVLEDVTASGRLRGGEVLVTRQTDPGWAPAFFLIRGLVIERGGMLSHGAIVAREFGIPCVVGVRGAMSRIADGALVRVDGDHGRVDVVR